MTIPDFLARRKADIVEFFSGRFGPRWRAEAFALIAAKGMEDTGWHNLERLAMSLGMPLSSPIAPLPSERNRVRHIVTVRETVDLACITRELIVNLTWPIIFFRFIQHKKPHTIRLSDVIPAHLLEFWAPDQRISNPSPGEVPQKSRVLDPDRAFTRLPGPSPAPQAPPATGGPTHPPTSLSAPSAHENPSREAPLDYQI